MSYRWVLLVIGVLCWQPAKADWNYLTVAGSGDVPLNVVTAGAPDAPAILFIHGIGQSHYSFVHQLNSDLADDYFLIAFDLRGHGASGKPWLPEAYGPPKIWAEDVAAVLAATGAERPVVVAWSYGTLVVMDYIREFGVDGLAGVNLTGALGALLPFRMPPEDPNTKDFLRLRELQLSPDLADNISANKGMVQWLTATPVSAQERDLFEAFTLMFPAYARKGMMQRKLNNQDLLGQLSLPVLLSLGEKDNPLQLEDGAVLDENRDNFSLSVFPDAGHSVFFEQPKRFNDELRQFVINANKECLHNIKRNLHASETTSNQAVTACTP